MKTAIITSKNNRRYTVEKYVVEFGPKLDARAQKRIRPTAVCVSCGHQMHTVAEDGPLRDATWAHNPDKDAPWCPLKQKGGAPYTLLTPGNPNEVAGLELRARFFRNWRIHWAHIIEIVPMCNIYTLIDFIKYADRTKFWEHVGLEEWLLPYIFLATCDFPPPKSEKGAEIRPEWIRCRFNARVRTPQDLWIHVNGNWGYTRAKYRAPARGAEPGPKHLIDAESITPDRDFLIRCTPKGNQFQIDAMKRAFPTELA
jgi:hypothetical protein